MKLLIFYADYFLCKPTMKTLEEFPEINDAIELNNSVLGFIHVEEKDLDNINKVTTKLIKNLKWVMNKTETKSVALHSFAHLSSSKADPVKSYEIFKQAFERLKNSGYQPVITPYGYFNDLKMELPGKPIARIFKDF